MSKRSLHPLGTFAPGLLIVLAAVGACSDGASVGPTLPPASFAGAELKAYRLGVGDKVRVTVFGETDLSGTFDINAQGRIPLPLVGEVQASGFDAIGLRDAIAKRYSEGYLKNPRLTVEVVGFRPIYVHGEVRSGGEFAFKTGLRLRDVIALAGGYTYRANQSYVILARSGTALDARVAMPTDMLVMPGDNIRVPERYF